MGLDMYFYAEKTLSAFKKKEKLYIDYFNTLNEPGINTAEGLFISEFWGNGKAIVEVLNTLPKLEGQVGEIRTIKKVGDDWVVYTEAGYWRKANQIHKWFVDNAQDGIDDCMTYPVDADILDNLMYDINLVLGDIKLPNTDKFFNENNNWAPPSLNLGLANDLLPSSSGFFFGNSLYDKWYFLDLKNTKRILKKVLKKSTKTNWKFNYHSSW